MQKFASIGIIKNNPVFDEALLRRFETDINSMRSNGSWSKEALVDLFNMMIPEFQHKETGKYLDQKM